MRRCVLLLGMLRALPAGAAFQVDFADDFESGQLLQIDGGQWTNIDIQAANQLFITAAAAHRGDGGARLLDADSVATPGSEGSLGFDLGLPLSGSYFQRMWFRVTPTADVGNFDLLQNFADGGGTAPFYPLAPRVYLPDGGLSLFAEDSLGTYTALDAQAPAGDGQWHLLETAMMGLGTDKGVRQAWFDGVLIADGGMGWTGLALTSFRIGEPHCEATRAFTGTIDFDDVRASVLWPGTFLNVVVTGTGPLVAGQCTPALVELVDENGALAPAPYNIAYLFAPLKMGVPVTASLDSDCTTVFAGLIPAGQSEQQIWIQALAPGIAYPTPAEVDFLNQVTGYTVIAAVGDAGVSDGGGVDGGIFDSGIIDGGPGDGGTEDGGLSDGGRVDGGVLDSGAPAAGATGTLSVGCGCSETSSATWLPVGAMAIWLARRRKRQSKLRCP